MYQIFLIQTAFQSSDRAELDFGGFMIRFSLNVRSQETKKLEVFSQVTDDSKNLRRETLCIADYKNVNISSFAAS